jgi:hypothetical protein
VGGCRTNLAFGSAVDSLHIHTTTRSRPHPCPTRSAPLPPLPRPIGASTQAAGARRRNEPTRPTTPTKPFYNPIPHPWTPLLFFLLLTLRHHQTRQPSIKLRSCGTEVGVSTFFTLDPILRERKQGVRVPWPIPHARTTIAPRWISSIRLGSVSQAARKRVGGGGKAGRGKVMKLWEWMKVQADRIPGAFTAPIHLSSLELLLPHSETH